GRQELPCAGGLSLSCRPGVRCALRTRPCVNTTCALPAGRDPRHRPVHTPRLLAHPYAAGRGGLTWSYRHPLPCQVEDGRGLRPAEALGEAQLHPVADAVAHHDSHVDGVVLHAQGIGQAGHLIAVVFHPLLEPLELVHLAPLPYSIITVVKTIHLELTTVNGAGRSWDLSNLPVVKHQKCCKMGTMGKGTLLIQRIEDLMRQHQMNAADLARASGLSEAAISY